MISPYCVLGWLRLGLYCVSAQLNRRYKSALKAVKASVPTFVVFVAILGIGKLLVGDSDLGGFAVRCEVNGDERVGSGTILPAPSVDELVRWVDEAIGAEDSVDITVFVSDNDAV